MEAGLWVTASVAMLTELVGLAHVQGVDWLQSVVATAPVIDQAV
jgi:hypothetical protein